MEFITSAEFGSDTRDTVFKMMLQKLRNDLQNQFTEELITAESIFGYEYFAKFRTLKWEHTSKNGQTGFTHYCFMTRRTKHLLGIWPRHTVQKLLEMDPQWQEMFNCVVYDERVVPFVKKRIEEVAPALGIETLNIVSWDKMGHLSLPTTQDGELSPTTQEAGGLILVEK